MADDHLVVDHPLVHAPGIYFGLPEEEYHAALALSASGIKALRVDPIVWWQQSPLNPDWVDEETVAKRIGKAFHARIVEGSAAFEQRYARLLDPGAYPNALRTVADLTDALARHNISSGRRLKGELIKLLLRHEPDAVIWDELVRQHAEIHDGKIMLDADLIDQIERAAGRVENHPELSKAFSDGEPEVSVFWVDDSGVPCKCRMDFLKARAIIDLKSFTLRDMLPDRTVAHAVASYKYHVQVSFYLRGAAAIPRLVEQGLVAGNHDPDFLRAVVDADDKTFLFVWQAQGMPVLFGKILGPGIVLDMGHAAVEDALIRWADAWRRWGPAEWNEIRPITRFDDSEFPPWIND